MPATAIIITPGTRFTDWTTSGRREYVDNRTLWECVCVCGVVRMVMQSSLRSGLSQSCGCRKTRIAKAAGKSCPKPKGFKSLGLSGSPEYKAWRSIKNRCGNPKDPGYKNYGGRGITICERWKDSFRTFYQDMGARPSPQHSIDRRNNERGYEPGNCRWATRKEQTRNTRVTHNITWNGETMCLTDWATRLGMTDSGMHSRLRLGWPIDKVVSTPVSRLHQHKTQPDPSPT